MTVRAEFLWLETRGRVDKSTTLVNDEGIEYAVIKLGLTKGGRAVDALNDNGIKRTAMAGPAIGLSVTR